MQQGVFGYTTVATENADGSLTVPAPSSVRLREPISPDQVELGDSATLLNAPGAVGMNPEISLPFASNKAPNTESSKESTPRRKASPAAFLMHL